MHPQLRAWEGIGAHPNKAQSKASELNPQPRTGPERVYAPKASHPKKSATTIETRGPANSSQPESKAAYLFIGVFWGRAARWGGGRGLANFLG